MYNWDAEVYRKSSGSQREWAQEVIKKLKLKGDERVLDIGCGDGRNTVEISSRLSTGSILGIDSSDEMIKFAKKNFPQEKYPNLDFKVLDFRDLNFTDEFNVIFSNAALHWVKDQLPILKSIKKSLKHDGYMLIQQGGHGKAILDEADELIKEEKWKPYFKDFEFPYGFYTPDIYREWLKKADLKPIRVELLLRVMAYEDLEGLKGFIRSVWQPYTEKVPENLREEFINEIATRYLEKYPNWETDGINIYMVRLEVEAKK